MSKWLFDRIVEEAWQFTPEALDRIAWTGGWPEAD